MNVLHAYTRRCLKKNRVRTLMTVIGITLSVAMFTAVTEAASSALNYLIEYTRATEGNYHGLFSDVTEEEYTVFSSDKRVGKVCCLSNEGYAYLDEEIPGTYIYLSGMGEGVTELIPVDISEGRMPENEKEVIIPNHLRNKALSKLKIGAELELDLGQRISEGKILNQRDYYRMDEELKAFENRTVTIVGFYNRLPTDFESYDTPGYTVLTVDNDGSPYDDYLLAFELKDPGDMQNIIDEYGTNSHIETNGRLLTLINNGLDSSTMKLIYSFAVILILIIMFGSVMLIYNSFAISISERTRQFGLLKSIGATKLQIRGSVAYEAFILCLVGIPLGIIAGCAGIGITFSLLGDSFGRVFSFANGLEMKLVIKLPALLSAAIIGLATTLISAMIPAVRAARLTPIEAIRQSGDVKIKGRQVKSRPLVRWVFGFEGDIASKNFRRNRKRYRAVVVSLFSSIVLFIAASTFCSLLTGSVQEEYDDRNGDITVAFYEPTTDTERYNTVFETLKSQSHVDSGSMKYFMYTFFHINEAYTETKDEFAGYLLFIDDDSFQELCKQHKLDAEDFYGETPRAIVFDEYRTYSENDGIYDSNILTDGIPDTISYDKYKHIPGYMLIEKTCEYDEIEDDYVNYCIYADTDYVGMTSLKLSAPEEYTKRYREDEVLERADIEVGTVIHDRMTDYNGLNVLMPEFRMAEMTDSYYDWMHMNFNAVDYMSAETEIADVLSECSDEFGFSNQAADRASEEALAKVINVMSYGFIILISLIALVNVFNTISTSVILRRREFAMLRSVGMTKKGFYKMMNYECLLYGLRSVAAGVPVSILASYLIHIAVIGKNGYTPLWISLAGAVGSVFVVVFISMIYAMQSIRKDNTIETLRNENI